MLFERLACSCVSFQATQGDKPQSQELGRSNILLNLTLTNIKDFSKKSEKNFKKIIYASSKFFIYIFVHIILFSYICTH